ncbi:hypothetical protein AB0M46_16790 [Dactylosporangium sp. NPDC051485]|uniref:hypothetical protein n=1 Tax=Dactylosporangium sp. NPDC051485 TaxID=3154846 RepID=UPI00342054A5
MGYVAFGARVLLCLTFAVAGVAKLRDRAGVRRSLAGLVPVPVSPAAVPVGGLLVVRADGIVDLFAAGPAYTR